MSFLTESKTAATTANSKTKGYTVNLVREDGKEMFLNGIFINVMNEDSVLDREGITLEQLFNWMVNKASSKGVTVSVREIGTTSKEPTGFFE